MKVVKVSRAIILIGFMGAGKSTIGAGLGEKLKRTFVDTDKAIEQREGMKVSAIFEQFGEAKFRSLETGLLKDLYDEGFSGVIATGGGIPLREENVKLLRKLGRVYFLSVDEETIYERVSGNTDRPLLNTGDLRERIHQLFEERGEKYSLATDIFINASRTPNAIIDDIESKHIKWEKSSENTCD